MEEKEKKQIVTQKLVGKIISLRIVPIKEGTEETLVIGINFHNQILFLDARVGVKNHVLNYFAIGELVKIEYSFYGVVKPNGKYFTNLFLHRIFHESARIKK